MKGTMRWIKNDGGLRQKLGQGCGIWRSAAGCATRKKAVSRRAGWRSDHQHPTMAVTTTKIWGSSTLPKTQWTTPKWWLCDHWWTRCYHPLPNPTSVPTTCLRLKIPPSFMHPPFLTWGIRTIKPVFPPDAVDTPDDNDNTWSQSLPPPTPSIDYITTHG